MAVTYILFVTNCFQHILMTDYSTPAVTVLQLKTTVLQQVDLFNGFSKGFVKILHLKGSSPLYVMKCHHNLSSLL